MNALIVYDTKYGNTKQVAETVREVTGGETIHVTEFNPQQLAQADLLIVGSPIHAWGPSEDTVHFLAQLGKTSLKGKYVAAFETGYRSMLAGRAAPKILKALTKVGGNVLAPAHKFIVEGSEGPLAPKEIEHAKEWAEELKKSVAVGSY